jgi:hypothetical protein
MVEPCQFNDGSGHIGRRSERNFRPIKGANPRFLQKSYGQIVLQSCLLAF